MSSMNPSPPTTLYLASLVPDRRVNCRWTPHNMVEKSQVSPSSSIRRPSALRKTSTFQGSHSTLDTLLERREPLRRVPSSAVLHKRQRLLRAATFWYNWIVWLFAFLVVASQALCLFSSSYESTQTMAAGRGPTLGPYSILGDNDFPYEDRCVVCVRQGRTYKPMRVRDAFSSKYAVEMPDQVSTGYRVISRDRVILREDATTHWTNACSMLAVTITNLVRSCTLLGYDVIMDRLNVAREDDTVWKIADSLPVLIIPVSDNALFGRFVIPSINGSACILRLEGAYVTPTMAEAWIWGVDRHVVEQSMREWLGAHKGSWRHGWLHNSDTGTIWYEDMFNSKQNSLNFLSRRFEGWTGTEMDCTTRPSVCKHLATDCRWGDTLHTSEQLEYLQLILAGDGTSQGLFQLNFVKSLKIWNVYTLALLVSNASVMIILSHWLIAICALHRHYRYQHEAVSTVSIGILSNNKGFVLLPLVLFPRLRVALAAFFTVGCAFEGEQLALSEAWFVIYPGIAQVLLFTFSAFNLAAKVCRRRMSDALFGPTLIFFCTLHLLKQPLANSTWLGYDGRIPTVISSS